MGEGDQGDRGRARVRPAGLVDVPALVRLITSHAEKAPPVVDRGPEQAQAVLRLLLAHHALEEGQVWVAEHLDELTAAAIWLPPGAGSAIGRFHGLIARELDAPPDLLALGEADDAALSAERAGSDGWTLVATGRTGDDDPHVLLDRLLAPGLEAVDRGDDTVDALAASAAEVDRLQAFGFGDTRKLNLPSGGDVWLTSLPSATARRPRR